MTLAEHPDPRMLNPVLKVVRFQQTGTRFGLAQAFLDSPELVIVDSFAPYVYRGMAGMQAWAERFSAHVVGMDGLRAELDTPQEFSRTAHTVYFSQPIRWRYRTATGNADEVGGLSVVLVQVGFAWKIKAMTWAVTSWRETRRN